MSCEMVICLLLWLCYQRNGNGYQIALDSFFEQMRCQDSRFEGLSVTAQAFSKARKKLRYEVLENLCQQTSEQKPCETFKGLNVYAIDGTGFRVPDTEDLNIHFNKHRAYSSTGYYPQGNLVAAVDVNRKTICHAIVDRFHSSEKSLTECLLNNFKKEALFVLDRGLATQNIFKAIFDNGQQVVARLRTDKQGLKCFQNFSESLKSQDYVKLPNGVTLRLLKVKIRHNKSPIIIGTTLPESLASSKDIKKLYESRWEVETVFNYIKTLQCLEKFHAKDYNGVMQELFAHFLLHNLTTLSYGEENNEDGQVNRKAMTTHFGQRLLALFILPIKNIGETIKSVLQDLWQLAETSRRKRRLYRSYPRISKQPVNTWSCGKHRNKELQRVMGLS